MGPHSLRETQGESRSRPSRIVVRRYLTARCLPSRTSVPEKPLHDLVSLSDAGAGPPLHGEHKKRYLCKIITFRSLATVDDGIPLLLTP